MVLRGAGDGCGDMLATSGGPSDQWVPLSAWSLLPVFYRNYSPKCVVFTARRYANAVFAVLVHVFVRPFVHVSVCLSVTSWYCIETTGRIELVFGVEAPIPHCVIRKCGYLQKSGYCPMELCPELPTLKLSLRQGALSTKLVDGRAC